MKTKFQIIDYVLQEMKNQGLTKISLGEILGANGVSQMKIQKANSFLSKKNQKIDMADLLLVSQFLGKSPREIMLDEKTGDKMKKNLPNYNINPNHLIPLLNNNGVNVIQEWLVYPYDNSAHKKITAIAMPNTHMQPEIIKGEIVFVDSRLYNFDLNEKIVLATYNKEFIIGRFRRLPNKQIKIYFRF